MSAEVAFINDARLLCPVPSALVASTAAGRIIRDRDETGFLARFPLDDDAQTKPAYGTLRTFAQYQINRLPDLCAGGGANIFTNQGGNDAVLRAGFIQLTGITAGRIQSFFDCCGKRFNDRGLVGSDIIQKPFACTYTGPGGLSATLSIEDRDARNLPQTVGNIVGRDATILSAAGHRGETVLDVVGQVDSHHKWSRAQLSSVYHQIQSTSGPFAGTNGPGFGQTDADGFAVRGGAQLKLSTVAIGEDLWLKAGCRPGADLDQEPVFHLTGWFQHPYCMGGLQHIACEAVAVRRLGTPATAYTLQRERGFLVLAVYDHEPTPNIYDVMYGYHERISSRTPS